MIAGDKDLFAPALDEQIEPFSWLPEIDKYLVLVKNGTHFSFIGGEDNSKLPWQSSNDDPALARSYLKILSVAFFKTHLNRQEEFSSYLTEPYVQSISKKPLPINIIRHLSSDRLQELINK